ncbi:MAG TPA: Ran-binding zinc finger domain-containing protein [Polyangia bacterium]|nr:Ran-binding zinc finger domain-containing protein [Polyangia bacterium]
MAWTCKSCGTKNPTNALKCGKCGGKDPAPRKISTSWIVGGGVFFFIAYVVGTFLGGTMLAVAVEPNNDDLMTAGGKLGIEAKTVEQMAPVDQRRARDEAIVELQKGMAKPVRAVLFWFLTLLIIPLGALVVGFVSEGRTVVEAAVGSLFGQGIGFVVMRFGYGMDIHWIELAVGLVVGFFIAAAGAYVGEAVQEKREREVLMMSELDEAMNK